ncbi:MAG: thiamine pyrophosphate-binding protein [Rhodospirillaceae bacterium]|nr:thiamine pyrophosphate-binding protein [Rhodospirillaceae bacterium]MBT6140302.1 thiamine pyrophosphate-binding protein [Rhodospirillaceae bacterium]
MTMNGSQIIAEALKRQGVDMFFFIMGGPMMATEDACVAAGLRAIDVRHEQAGAMAAHAYARLRRRPGVCMSASGPAMTNLVTGVAHAFADGVPILAIGGAAPTVSQGRGVFQEMDQLSIMRPCTKWCERVHHPARIPELIDKAFRIAMSGKPGPVYLDLPGDILYQDIDEETINWPEPWDPAKRPRAAAMPDKVEEIVELLEAAENPVLLTGSGILWSEAEEQLQAFVDKAGIPFYTTPQGRGVVPEDHECSYPTARSTAFREADLIMIVGTRMNYIIGHAAPPRFNADARIVRIDVDPEEIGTSPRLNLGVIGDARTVLEQLCKAIDGRVSGDSFASWRDRLRGHNSSKTAQAEQTLANDATPIHPLRLCKEVRDFMDRDGILVVDGQEILNYGRQSIPCFTPGHRMNSGVFGTMGVGMPFGVGAKAAQPESQVVVLHGDGSFGLNAMEFDTAVRHNLPILVVISLNGGWTADPTQVKTGRNLGYTRYDKIAEALGGHGELVENPDDIRPALERAAAAMADGKPALVNVVTDWQARATTAAFTNYAT